MTTITIPQVTLTINSSNIVINSTPLTNSESGSITNLLVNGTFQATSGSYIGYYSATFPLTSSNDLSSSIASLDTLVQSKVRTTLGL
jgi:hypothetical protein